VKLLGPWWTNWTIFVMPSGAFFLLASFIWVVKGYVLKEQKK